MAYTLCASQQFLPVTRTLAAVMVRRPDLVGHWR